VGSDGVYHDVLDGGGTMKVGDRVVVKGWENFKTVVSRINTVNDRVMLTLQWSFKSKEDGTSHVFLDDEGRGWKRASDQNGHA
jgi:hypothetical protein